MKQILIGIALSLIVGFTDEVRADNITFTEEEQVIVSNYEKEIDGNLEKDTNGSYKRHYIYTFEEALRKTQDDSKKKIFSYLLKSLESENSETTIKENNLSVYNIDTTSIMHTWISWQNKVRNKLGLSSYIYDETLSKSALKWSQISKERGYIDHRRSKGDAYYNYKKIENWMKGEGIVCKNNSRRTFSESIGYGFFTCSDDECSDELTEGIKSTFDFFMSEKGKKYAPHYNAIINPYFSQIGVGIELAKTGRNSYKYYLTTHYCTELITNQK